MSTVSYTGSTEHTFARGGGNTNPNQRNFFFITNTSGSDTINVSFNGDILNSIPIEAGGHYQPKGGENVIIKVFCVNGASFVVHSDLHEHSSV